MLQVCMKITEPFKWTANNEKAKHTKVKISLYHPKRTHCKFNSKKEQKLANVFVCLETQKWMECIACALEFIWRVCIYVCGVCLRAIYDLDTVYNSILLFFLFSLLFILCDWYLRHSVDFVCNIMEWMVQNAYSCQTMKVYVVSFFFFFIPRHHQTLTTKPECPKWYIHIFAHTILPDTHITIIAYIFHSLNVEIAGRTKLYIYVYMDGEWIKISCVSVAWL